MFMSVRRTFIGLAALLAWAPAGAQAGNNAQIVSGTPPGSLAAGQTVRVSVTVRNTGTTTWSGGGGDNPSPWRLASLPSGSFNEVEWVGFPQCGGYMNGRPDDARVFLCNSVAPNQEHTFELDIRMPSGATGSRRLAVQMVQDGLEFFGATRYWNIAVSSSGGCPCSSTPGFDNFCFYPPNTPGCTMTAPFGYCDRDGNGFYNSSSGDTDWERGFYDYHAQCSGGGGTPTPTPPPSGNRPDLIVTRLIAVPASPRVGEPVYFEATVKNAGSVSTPNGTPIGVGFGVHDGYWGWNVQTAPLAPGASRTFQLSDSATGAAGARWRPSAAGPYTVTALVDDVNRIVESNDGNNSFQISVSVSGTTTTPTPTPTAPTPTPTPPPAGASIKGAGWLLFDGGYDNLPAGVPPVAWDIAYAQDVSRDAWKYNEHFKPRGIRVLARIESRPSATEVAAMEAGGSCGAIADVMRAWDEEVRNALAGSPDTLHAFILGNEPNILAPSEFEVGLSGRAYAWAYNCYRAQVKTTGLLPDRYLLLAAGPGGCGVPDPIVKHTCTSFYDGMLGLLGAVDGFAIHAYGSSGFRSSTHDLQGFAPQIARINGKKKGVPIFITEYNEILPDGQGGFQPAASDPASWKAYMNGRYNDVLDWNAKNANQVKGIFYFLDAPDRWPRMTGDFNDTSLYWWKISLRADLLAHDGRRDAWKLAPSTSQVMTAGAVQTYTASIAPGQGWATFATAWPGSDVVLSLVSPSGRLIDRFTPAGDVAHVLTGTSEQYHVKDPEAGEWTVRLWAAEVDPAGEEVHFSFTTQPAGAADRTAPVIVPAVSGTAGASGWYTSDVTVTFDVADTETGIANASGCEPVTLTAETTGTPLTCWAVNGAGLSASRTVVVKIDKTPPRIAVSSPQPISYPRTGTVTLAWTISEALSGLLGWTATLDRQPAAVGTAVDLAGLTLGAHTLAVEATDHAGNLGRASVTFQVVVTFASLEGSLHRACDTGAITKEGICRSLAAKLAAAAEAHRGGRTRPAAHLLEAFRSELRAQRGKAVSEAAFARLDEEARALLASLATGG